MSRLKEGALLCDDKVSRGKSINGWLLAAGNSCSPEESEALAIGLISKSRCLFLPLLYAVAVFIQEFV